MSEETVLYHVIETEEELDEVIQNALEGTGSTLEELREQAKSGYFDSEEHRIAWFVITGLGRG